MRWTVLIPVKALPAAKSRLTPASADPMAHRRLVEAIRADTIAATLAAADVARVVLVVDRPQVPDGAPGVLTLVQSRPGLDAAVTEAAAHAAAHWADDGVAALVGDLPALTGAALTDALRAAADYPSAFVPDTAGTGTTMLTAAPGHSPRPAFGVGSAARHVRTARAIVAAAGLRADVDTVADLEAAAVLGVGPATQAVLDDPAMTFRRPCSGIVGS